MKDLCSCSGEVKSTRDEDGKILVVLAEVIMALALIDGSCVPGVPCA